jgi:hypothetical protein
MARASLSASAWQPCSRYAGRGILCKFFQVARFCATSQGHDARVAEMFVSVVVGLEHGEHGRDALGATELAESNGGKKARAWHRVTEQLCDAIRGAANARVAEGFCGLTTHFGLTIFQQRDERVRGPGVLARELAETPHAMEARRNALVLACGEQQSGDRPLPFLDERKLRFLPDTHVGMGQEAGESDRGAL